MLVTMKELLDRANEEGYAVPAPNVATELDARAFLEVAEELNSPMILDVGFSCNPDLVFLGSYLTRLAEKAKVPVAVHLDHGAPYEEFTQCIMAIRAGFTSIMVDRSTLPFEENIKQVREMAQVAHAIGVTVEAELGHVASGIQYENASDMYTDPAMAKEFVEFTGIDCLAVAIGNAHGMYKGVPKLDFERLAAIKKATNNLPLVLHGSSGLPYDEIKKACANGINKVNVNQELLENAATHIGNADLTGNGAYNLYNTLRNGLKERLTFLIQNCYGSENKAFPVQPKGLGDVALMVMSEA